MNIDYSNPLSSAFTDEHQTLSFESVKGQSLAMKILRKVRGLDCSTVPAPIPGCGLSWKW